MCANEAGVFRLALLDPDALRGISAALIASICLCPALLCPFSSCSQQHIFAESCAANMASDCSIDVTNQRKAAPNQHASLVTATAVWHPACAGV